MSKAGRGVASSAAQSSLNSVGNAPPPATPVQTSTRTYPTHTHSFTHFTTGGGIFECDNSPTVACVAIFRQRPSCLVPSRALLASAHCFCRLAFLLLDEAVFFAVARLAILSGVVANARVFRPAKHCTAITHNLFSPSHRDTRTPDLQHSRHPRLMGKARRLHDWRMVVSATGAGEGRS